jgi:hypothetical protein
MLIDLTNDERIALCSHLCRSVIETNDATLMGLIVKLTANPKILAHNGRTADVKPKHTGGWTKGKRRTPRPAKKDEENLRETKAEETAPEIAAYHEDNFFDEANPDHKMILVTAMGRFGGNKDELRAHWKSWIARNPAQATVDGLLEAFERCVNSSLESAE